MTDLPKAARASSVGDLLPPLLTHVRDLDCDDGTTRKSVWRLFDGATVESVLMRYPDRVTMCVSSQAGCGMNCPFCATGQAGSHPQPVGRRDRRPGRRRGAHARSRRARRADPRLERRVHGHGRAARELQGRARGRAPDDRPRPRRARHVAAQHHRLHRRPGAGDGQAHRRGPVGHAGGVAARPGRRAARHARAGQHALERRRGARGGLALHRPHPAAGSPSSTR